MKKPKVGDYIKWDGNIIEVISIDGVFIHGVNINNDRVWYSIHKPTTLNLYILTKEERMVENI